MKAPAWWWTEKPEGAAKALIGALAPFEWVYRRAVVRRTSRRPRERVDVPVFSVGNLTVGGTGKTPIVRWLVETLQAHDLQPAIVCRGYGGPRANTPQIVTPDTDPARAADEALETSRLCPQTPVIVSPKRAAGARFAQEQCAATCVVLDDAFQHTALHRDVDLVCIDAARPFGNGHCLPAGPLREPLTALRRAHLVLLTRTEQLDDAGIQVLRTHIRRYTDQPTVAVAFRCRAFRDLFEPELKRDAEELRGAVLLSGIGHPEAFRSLVEHSGVDVSEHMVFPDHANYTQRLADRLRALRARHVIVTGKDAVKLRPLLGAWRKPHISVAELGLEQDSRQRLREALEPLI